MLLAKNLDTINATDEAENFLEEEKQQKLEQEKMKSMIESHELMEAYDESGNSAERDINERYNNVHDAKTGRFGFKNSNVDVIISNKNKLENNLKLADETTQDKHKAQIKELEKDRYSDGTYNLDTLKEVSYKNGYQVTFCQIGDNYNNSDYADRVNEFLKVSSDGIVSAGKFGGTPEVSFHINDIK